MNDWDNHWQNRLAQLEKNIARLEAGQKNLLQLYNYQKNVKTHVGFNAVPCLATLIECSPISTSVLIKPFLKAYRTAIKRALHEKSNLEKLTNATKGKD